MSINNATIQILFCLIRTYSINAGKKSALLNSQFKARRPFPASPKGHSKKFPSSIRHLNGEVNHLLSQTTSSQLRVESSPPPDAHVHISILEEAVKTAVVHPGPM